MTTVATLSDASSDGVTVEICRNDVCSTLVRKCRNDACVPDDSPGFMGGLDTWLDAVPLGETLGSFASPRTTTQRCYPTAIAIA